MAGTGAIASNCATALAPSSMASVIPPSRITKKVPSSLAQAAAGPCLTAITSSPGVSWPRPSTMRLYTPSISAMVLADNPGTVSANPMLTPRKKVRR